jgi:phosphoglycerol transferase MdoB-like AlkP superfamily enzyme
MKLTSFLQRPRKRPFGISVIIFMLVLYVLFLGIALFASFKVPVGEVTFWMMKINNPVTMRIVFLAIILLEASIVVGLWRMQRFAWVLIMIQVGLSMAFDLWGYLHGYPSHISMLIDVIIVFYLNQREVQRAFSSTPGWGAEWTT